jgi:hypothetical protein
VYTVTVLTTCFEEDVDEWVEEDTVTMTVNALPDWVVGTFEGYFDEYGWYDEWRQEYPESDLPSGCDWEAIGRFTVTISKEGKVSGKFIKAHESQQFTAKLVDVQDGQYVFSQPDYKANDGNGGNESGEFSFTVGYGEYDGVCCGQIEGLLAGREDSDEDPSPFYREVSAKQNLWSIEGVALPTVNKTAKYSQRYNDDIYDIEGELTLEFSAGRNTVVASFLFDDEEDRKYLKMTQCTSQLIVTDYDATSGVFNMLLPVYMKHLDDPDDDEWIDLDFLIPMEIDIEGNVNILWDDVEYAHDDWW